MAVMKKNKISKKDSSVAERRFGVVLESIDSKFDLVLEGHSVLDHKIDGVESRLTGGIKELNFKVEILAGDLKDFKKDTQSSFQTVFDYLSNADKEFDFIKSEIADIKLEIADLKTKIEEKYIKRIEELEKRVEKLELTLAQKNR